ncbi:uncharacterized protein CC84DRAFT_127041 [Paraphaeosphaeria sporulosa]|uniref:Uncharacterized protein n=1 Tax=Paraphaeosphaeria sporulosa TaxID=1460663 RepID=A0A177CZ53_9PLEO|nr:uncharacterized protein CC84DRAFT_127041 [Paraphaeosphaeria sporulosa]OAG12556.1 hypothetical protein CC84DRAFT_127041 [Paraphaeosphaeria sporulosa]
MYHSRADSVESTALDGTSTAEVYVGKSTACAEVGCLHLHLQRDNCLHHSWAERQNRNGSNSYASKPSAAHAEPHATLFALDARPIGDVPKGLRALPRIRCVPCDVRPTLRVVTGPSTIVCIGQLARVPSASEPHICNGYPLWGLTWCASS